MMALILTLAKLWLLAGLIPGGLLDLPVPAGPPDVPLPPSVTRLATIQHLPLVARPEQQPPEVHAGEGTYYDANGDGNCMFGPSPDDLLVAAMNNSDYGNAGLCGAYVRATGPNGTVDVRIVDRCPECAPGDLDFSREAFARIAEMAAGRVPIRWHLISPELTGPIVYRFKEGSNPWWLAVQIRNHRNPIERVEYSLDGSWHSLPRQQYNYFVESSGLGGGPFTFRVTDIYGNALVDTGIPFSEGGEVAGAAQFPAGP